MPKLCSAVGAERWPQPEPGAAASRGKPPTPLNLLPEPLRARGISKNSEATSPQTLCQWNCAPGIATVCPEWAVCYLKSHKTQHTSHPPHHASLWTNTTTDFLTTASISFFLSRGGKKPAQIFFYITYKWEECFMFPIYFQFTAVVSILVAMCIL